MPETITGTLPPQTHTQTIDRRKALGKSLREKCDRRSHAAWTPSPNRRDPVEILIEQGQSRLADLLPLRYARMSVSPFAFLRGGAAVMAADLAATPSNGLMTQAAGDCHCLNFGGFATPERRLVFDLNDFDETAVAPWEWDLKRLAASFVVATLDALDKEARLDLARLVSSSYRATMIDIAARPILDSWYRGLAIDSAEAAEALGIGAPAIRKARDFLTHGNTVDIHRRPESGLNVEPRIADDPPLVYHPTGEQAAGFDKAVDAMLIDYRASLTPERRILLERHRRTDAAYKVVGVGSVGTMCGVVMMVSGSGEILNLQFKEATQSVLEPFAGKSPYPHHGERVVRGQRLLQAASDILLGFGTGPTGRHIYVRQLRDAKVKPALETMTARHFRRYATTCGEALARAHARTADAVVLAAYLGQGPSFDEAIGAFSTAYGKQTEQDHESLQKAIKSGRLTAAADPS